jgi:hypothetical protein
MDKIYCFINARGQGGRTDVLVEALCEDGDFLASHRSSNESWAKYDIGVSSEHQHVGYEDHCPGGYTLEWVDYPLCHVGLKAAYQKHCHLPKRSEAGSWSPAEVSKAPSLAGPN